MIVLEFLNIVFIITYLFVIGWFGIGWLKSIKLTKPETLLSFSVLVPFRNEVKNIANLIQSFSQLNYNLSLVEFVFIDDHSTDNSSEISTQELRKTKLLYKIVRQKKGEEGKKRAIISGVHHSKNENIITTDADCTHSKYWLSEYNKAFFSKAQFIVAPVINVGQSSFVGQLQNIEALVLCGVTIGSAKNKFPFLCSGANMGYKKSLFLEHNPYASNLSIPSGDDLFFLDLVIQKNISVTILDSPKATAYTNPPKNYNALIQQALRWSSKNGKLNASRNFWLSILVFLVNLLIIPNLFLFDSFSLFLVVKFLIDFTFFGLIAVLFNQKKLLFFTPFIFILYPIHLLIIFAQSFFVKVKWKERKLITDE